VGWKDYDCWGCEGCFQESHLEFLQDHGAMRESDYKYKGRHLGRCDHDFDKVVGYVDTFDRIKRSLDEMKERVAQQPVAISLCVQDSTWDQY